MNSITNNYVAVDFRFANTQMPTQLSMNKFSSVINYFFNYVFSYSMQ